MKHVKLVLIIAALALTVGCGSSSKTVTTQPGQPLDPQGNWLFSLTDTQETWAFAGQLYELTPPTVTAPNGLNAFGSCNAGTAGNLVLSSPAQVTGTASITFNFVSSGQSTSPASYTLTGTIATDQQHISGNFTGSSPCGLVSPSGSWTAQLIPSVTGTWTGTAQGATVTAAVTENTDQTSASMGQLTGTLDISGSPCIQPGTYNVQNALHVAESVNVSVSDSTGTTLTGVFTVDPASPNSASGNVFYAGGTCDGQGFAFTLARQ